MIYSIIAKKDATIYERSSSMNTGIDEILEIEKTVSSSGTSNIYNSRILIKFDIAEISSSIVAGLITSPNYYLNLYTNKASSLDYKYGLEAFPISQSWEMGRGRTKSKKTTDSGATKYEEEGVSWEYRDGRFYFGNKWATSSFFSSSTQSTTGSFTTTGGGGTWYTGSGYVASQSFDYEQTDVRMKVNDIVNKWLDSSVPNEGFIVLRSGSNQPGNINEEKNGRPYGSLQYFSTDTHMVYQPKLEVSWDDSVYSTGSLTEINPFTTEAIIDVKNNKGSYKKSSREKIRLVVREKYPAKTYATKSEALTLNVLPSASYYSVKDMITEETIIPFDSSSTLIGADAEGNFFNLWMNQFYDERRYKFIFRSISGSYQTPVNDVIFDNDYTFKVVR